MNLNTLAQVGAATQQRRATCDAEISAEQEKLGRRLTGREKSILWARHAPHFHIAEPSKPPQPPQPPQLKAEPPASRVRAVLCDCENLGWPGSDRCPVHPDCTSKTGCLDYPDPFKGPHEP